MSECGRWHLLAAACGPTPPATGAGRDAGGPRYT